MNIDEKPWKIDGKSRDFTSNGAIPRLSELETVCFGAATRQGWFVNSMSLMGQPSDGYAVAVEDGEVLF